MKKSHRNSALLASGLTACLATTVTAQSVSAASTITLTAHETTSGTNRGGASGVAVGDVIAYTETLSSPSTGSAAGYDAVSCTVVRVLSAAKRAGILECTLTARLKDGTLSAQGIVWQNGSDSRLAITGGTGAYDGAAGNLLVSSPTVDTTQLTFAVR